MDNYFLYGSGTNPDIIIGKYTDGGFNSSVAGVLDESGTASWRGIKINKYEFWFSTTISFIPYSGESVFITDVSGNLTHTGNLLTKKDATIEKKLTVKDDTTLEKKLTVKDATTLDKQLTVNDNVFVNGVLHINGQPLSAYITSQIGAAVAAATAELKTDLAGVKKTAEAAAASAASTSKKASGGSSGGGSAPPPPPKQLVEGVDYIYCRPVEKPEGIPIEQTCKRFPKNTDAFINSVAGEAPPGMVCSALTEQLGEHVPCTP